MALAFTNRLSFTFFLTKHFTFIFLGVVLLHTALGILHTHRRRGKNRGLLHTDIFFSNKKKIKNENL